MFEYPETLLVRVAERQEELRREFRRVRRLRPDDSAGKRVIRWVYLPSQSESEGGDGL